MTTAQTSESQAMTTTSAKLSADERMTPSELSRLESLAKAATPGPWRYDGEPTISVYVVPEKGWPICQIPIGAGEWHAPRETHQGRKDAAFIAALNPSTVLRLIAMARKG